MAREFTPVSALVPFHGSTLGLRYFSSVSLEGNGFSQCPSWCSLGEHLRGRAEDTEGEEIVRDNGLGVKIPGSAPWNWDKALEVSSVLQLGVGWWVSEGGRNPLEFLGWDQPVPLLRPLPTDSKSTSTRDF